MVVSPPTCGPCATVPDRSTCGCRGELSVGRRAAVIGACGTTETLWNKLDPSTGVPEGWIRKPMLLAVQECLRFRHGVDRMALVDARPCALAMIFSRCNALFFRDRARAFCEVECFPMSV